MKIDPARPDKATLRFYGGKYNLAPWIIEHFPTHDSYLEPFFGGGSVLCAKPPSPIETVNDMDGRVVNFWLMLRTHPSRLMRAIRHTPWAREEFIKALEISEDSLEDARRFFVSCWMSMNGSTATVPGDWRRRCEGDSPATETLEIDHLYVVAERMRSVQIENRDALHVIPLYDRPNALIYADPPYLPSLRGGHYKEDVDEDYHIKLAGVLRECLAAVVVSGYPSALYEKLYAGWTRVDKEDVAVNAGSKRTESLWLSPSTIERLGRPMQARLL